ncbi:MAG: hypothetical protein KatS3mg060_2296 [Dehalococcoidia bacterium]|nr:MAG: hypothetical protein KatS3mg060_2296 [Dehalococcoidia bacterium]
MERRYSTLAQPGAPLEKLLGDLEREIMEAMWARGGLGAEGRFGPPGTDRTQRASSTGPSDCLYNRHDRDGPPGGQGPAQAAPGG